MNELLVLLILPGLTCTHVLPRDRAFVHLLFVPEREFQPIFNSGLGVDFVKMILHHLFAGTEVLGDFAIL